MIFDLSPALVELLGYVASGAVFLTFTMRTMLTLRVIAIISNVFFIAYALAGGLMPVLLLHGLLLPMNCFRLWQMQMQVKAAEHADRLGDADTGFAWLAPMAKSRRLEAGEYVFRKGDEARSLFVITAGEVALPEIGVTLGAGALIGEIGLFSQDSRRTASARAVGPVTLGEITAGRIQQLYFDNPRFAYRLLRLITERLVADLRQAEAGGGQRA